MEYTFLVKSTKIESETFPCKPALSEANLKTYRTGSSKSTYHKDRRFASNYFIFSEAVAPSCSVKKCS